MLLSTWQLMNNNNIGFIWIKLSLQHITVIIWLNLPVCSSFGHHYLISNVILSLTNLNLSHHTLKIGQIFLWEGVKRENQNELICRSSADERWIYITLLECPLAPSLYRKVQPMPWTLKPLITRTWEAFAALFPVNGVVEDCKLW